MVCINCSKLFDTKNKNRKFCSNSCSAKYNNSIRYAKVTLLDSDTKVCINCNENKNVSFFYKRNGSVDGYRNNCKECFNKNVCQNPKRKENKKRYYTKNMEDIKSKTKEYYAKNIDKIKENKKNYAQKNKDSRNKYLKMLYETDTMYKLSVNMRSSILKAFKRNGYKKNSKTFLILGCSFEDLKIHIENQFKEGMSWLNHGEWHIDHKIPLSWAKDEEELIKMCHYTNLQPLWAFENLSKKNYYSN
jgi:hypothetical protein